MTRKIPKLRFKGFTDAWEQRKLSEVFKTIGNAFVGTATPYYVDSGHFYLESNNVKDGQINHNTEVFINDEFYEKQRDKWLHTGDMVMVQSGHVGHAAVIPEELDNTAAHALIMFKNLKMEVEPYFLNYQYQTNKSKRKLDNITVGNTIKHILASNMQEFVVELPKFEEQKQISRCFRTLDNLITLCQRRYSKLQNLKKAYLSEMFPLPGEKVPRRRFQGFTDDWEQRKLGDIGDTYTGLAGKTKEDFGHGEARFVTYMNVFSNSIADKDMVESVEIDNSQNSVQYGDVFFTTSSETPEEVGMSCVWLENDRNIYLNSFCFGYRPKMIIDPYFMAYALRSDEVRKKIVFLAQGISRYNISKNKVMDIDLPLPNIDEQKLLGRYFHNLDNLITFTQRKLEKLQSLKKAYLSEMFPK